MTALPVMVAVPQKFHVTIKGPGNVDVPIANGASMSFASSDPTKAAVVATGPQDVTVTPVGANSDGTSAPVTVQVTLPASAVYGAAAGGQDLVVGVIPISALVFAPVA